MLIFSHDRLKNIACPPGRRAFLKHFPKNLVLQEWTPYHQGLLLAHPDWKRFWGFAARTGIIPRLPITGLDLRGADFSEADICFADFSGSNLSGVNFRKANAYKTNFYNCNLSGADFTEANIKFANFTAANLYQTNFTSCIGN